MSKITRISRASATPAATTSLPASSIIVPGADGPSAVTSFEATLGAQRNVAVAAHEASAQATAISLVAALLGGGAK
jgi:hypothetical protein